MKYSKLKPLGIGLLILGFMILEINLLFIWYFPYMDVPNAAPIYTISIVCRILIYTLICTVYDNLWDKYYNPPRKLKNGDRIKLTYLRPCRNGRGQPNPYIGMSGVVHDLTERDFSLLTETSWLVFIDLKTTKYIHIK